MRKTATPYMGWNSWDCYGAAVTEDIVRANADFMANNLKKYGWEYIVVDIQWYEPTASSHNYNAFPKLAMEGFGRFIPAEITSRASGMAEKVSAGRRTGTLDGGEG